MSARQKILFFEQRSRGIACQQPPSPPSAPKAKPGMPSQVFFFGNASLYVQYVTFLTLKMLNFLVGFLLVTSCLSWNPWNVLTIFNRKSKRRYPWRGYGFWQCLTSLSTVHLHCNLATCTQYHSFSLKQPILCQKSIWRVSLQNIYLNCAIKPVDIF